MDGIYRTAWKMFCKIHVLCVKLFQHQTFTVFYLSIVLCHIFIANFFFLDSFYFISVYVPSIWPYQFICNFCDLVWWERERAKWDKKHPETNQHAYRKSDTHFNIFISINVILMWWKTSENERLLVAFTMRGRLFTKINVWPWLHSSSHRVLRSATM